MEEPGVIGFIRLQDAAESRMALSVCHGCDACWLRCSSEVPAAEHEWNAICAYISGAPQSEQERISTVEGQNKSVDLGDDVSVSMCRYFDMESKRCAVYQARPLACRLLGHVEWMPCPIDKVPHRLETGFALKLLGEYSNHERKTFAEWERFALTPLASARTLESEPRRLARKSAGERPSGQPPLPSTPPE